MSEAEVNAIVGERCEKILLDVAEILGVKSPEEVLEAVQGSALRCLRCKEIGGHTDYCMVAENLARGVPEFWAPWAMWTFPDVTDHVVLLDLICMSDGYEAHGDVWSNTDVGIYAGETIDSMRRLGLYETGPIVALGPNGPTLEPWELK